MSARLKGRRRQVAALLPAVTAWAADRVDIVGLILVGSYARDRPRIGSDVDLILITTHPDRYLGHDDEWEFALYDPATDAYTDTALPDGSFTATPQDALDCACRVHAADIPIPPPEPL